MKIMQTPGQDLREKVTEMRMGSTGLALPRDTRLRDTALEVFVAREEVGLYIIERVDPQVAGHT